MKSVFHDILTEREFTQPLRYVPRTQTFATLSHKALAVIGIRRCGKTTFLRQIWDALSRKETIDSSRLIYVNFFDERLFNLQASQLHEMLDAYYELHPQAKSAQPLFFFLDEIQMVPGLETGLSTGCFARRTPCVCVNRIIRRACSAANWPPPCEAACSAWKCSPSGFEEILATAEKRDFSAADCARASPFPFPVQDVHLKNVRIPETLAWRRLCRYSPQDYLDTVLLRDIIERHNPSDPSAIMHLSHLLMNQSAGLFTLNKTCERLKAQGLKVNKPEISRALEWFYDSYLFYFSVPYSGCSPCSVNWSTRASRTVSTRNGESPKRRLYPTNGAGACWKMPSFSILSENHGPDFLF